MPAGTSAVGAALSIVKLKIFNVDATGFVKVTVNEDVEFPVRLNPVLPTPISNVSSLFI
jgi:hypothetical protein